MLAPTIDAVKENIASNKVIQKCGGTFVGQFEDKFEIDENKKKFPKPANLDVTIELLEKNKIIAIESKFTEPYGSVNVKISKSYLEESLWNKYPDLKKLKNLTENIYNKKCNFQYLDAAQLIKHILGLKNSKYKENSIF